MVTILNFTAKKQEKTSSLESKGAKVETSTLLMSWRSSFQSCASKILRDLAVKKQMEFIFDGNDFKLYRKETRKDKQRKK